MTKTMNASEKLDQAAVRTTETVAQAMRVRSLSFEDAVSLVARETGTTDEMVRGLLARCLMMAG